MQSTKRLQAFKFELCPNGEQARDMRRFAGSCRFAYNKALALQKKLFESGQKKLGYAGLCKALTDWKKDSSTGWLAQAPVHPLQQSLKDLERSYSNFFAKRAEFPRFKKKGCSESFRYPDAKQFEVDQANSRIKLPKLGWIRYRNSREILGIAKNITISGQGGKWYASIQTEREVELALPTSTTSVGIDLGIATFATLSDGSTYAGLNSFKAHQTELAKAQRAMSRKTKFSSNWRKAKKRVTRINTRIANCRRDYVHKATSAISKNHALVFVEDLQVGNMSKSAKGTKDVPGKSVKAKSGLNCSILDQAWGETRRQLEYKTTWNNGVLMAVPPQYTSQQCSGCEHVSKENRKSQSVFKCVACGLTLNADLNAAINIEIKGHAALAKELLQSEGQDFARIVCEVNDAVMPSAAETHRSDLEGAPCAN